MMDRYHVWLRAIRSAQGEVFFLLLSLSLIPYLLFAFHAHPSHDDFCFAYRVRAGFLEAQIEQYLTWSGRYGFTFIMSTFALLGPIEETFSLLIMLELAVLYTSIVIFVRSICRGQATLLSLNTAALAILLTILLTVRRPAGYFYWLAGAYAYPFSFSLLLLLLSAIINGITTPSRSRRGMLLLCAAVLAFLLPGINETLLLPTMVILVGALVVVWRLKPLAWRFVGAVGAIFFLGSAIAVLAPGNVARRLSYDLEPPSLVGGAFISLIWSARAIAEWATEIALIALSAFLVCTLGKVPLGAPSMVRRRPAVAYLAYGSAAVVLIMLVLGATFPYSYALGEAPRARIANTAYLVFILGWVPLVFQCIRQGIDHFQFEQHIRSISVASFIVLMVSLVQSDNFGTLLSDLRHMDRFDDRVRQRYSLIAAQKRAGETDVVLPPVMMRRTHLMFEDISEDPDHWSNACLAGYYELDSIRLIPGP